ncbi:MAG: hypothetical protein ACKVT0_10565 [Planctomycetaceae bacterium]
MSSPFNIFRKHQKILMVVFTGLAMFSFIFLDSLQSSQEAASPIIIGILFGGFAMWIIGLIRGKWLEYALIGMAGGAVAGFFMTLAGEPPPRVTTTLAEFSDQDLQKLVNKRYIANQFLAAAYIESRKPEEREFAQVPRSAEFSFGRPVEEDVVLGELLCEEGKQMGLIVSDQTVERFINQVTNEQLSRAKYEKIVRQDMRVSPVELYDILREQLLARQAFQMIVPRNLLSPEQYWQYYQKFNVRRELVLTAVPVESFEPEVTEPKDEDLKEFFAAHREVFPNQTAEGAPGFRVPRKVSIGYLEARPSSIEPDVKPVTDAEIENYYNENKELYRELSTNLLEGNTPSSEEKPDDTTPESEKPADETPASDDDSKSDGETPSTEEKPDADGSETEKSDTEKSDESSDASGLNPTVPTAETASIASPNSTQAVFSVEDAAAEEPKSDDAAEAVKPNESATEDAKPAETTSEPPASETPDTPATTEGTPKPDMSEPKYRPLDDDLKAEIRDDLHRQQLRELIKKRMDEAQTFMSDLSGKYRLPDDPEKKMTPTDVAEAMKAYAAKQGLVYGEIPLSSFEELEDSVKYPMASAEEPTDNPLAMQEQPNVRMQMFQTGLDQLYLVLQAKDPITDVSYAYWKTGDVDSHVATFEDEGIREQVLEAWKRVKARPLAEKRAKELVEKLKKDERPWEEALAETTVTGAQEGLQLSVQTTESFSWMRTTTAPSANPLFSFPQPELSTISSVKMAGDSFMKAVFHDLKDGEVGIAPNADLSIYYVVKARNRFPSTPAEVEAQRQAFMKEDLFFFSPYFVLSNMEHNESLAKWSQQLELKYAVMWRNDDPSTDGPPLEE